jgi:hypothetical protein
LPLNIVSKVGILKTNASHFQNPQCKFTTIWRQEVNLINFQVPLKGFSVTKFQFCKVFVGRKSKKLSAF